MEPVRPLVDRFVLDLLADRFFATADFHETRQGACRITPDHAGPRPRPRRDVVRMGSRGRACRRGRRAAPDRPGPAGGADADHRPQAGRVAAAGRATETGWIRPECRQPALRHVWGTDRRPATRVLRRVRDGRRRRSGGKPRDCWRGDFTALREVGFHRELSPAGRKRIGTRATELLRAAQTWRRTHEWPEDMGAFAREILPGLADVPASTLAQATGLSSGYLRRVKAGEVTPHPMWWETLATMSR